MKALDTPVLLDLLRGSPDARRYVRQLGAEEIATTEVNMWELGELALADGAPGRDRRLAALERLRRKLIVLPLDEGGVRSALHIIARGRVLPSERNGALIRGILEAHRCSEWVTVAAAWPKGSRGELRFVEYPKCARTKSK